MVDRFDYVLAGGGLQSGLIALALRHHQPEALIAIVERDGILAGNHTWSLHSTDIHSSSEPWLDPLIEYRWPGYEVRLGNQVKKISIGYASVSSQHFAAEVISAASRSQGKLRVFLNTSVEEVGADRVILAGGRELRANCVIDSRGPRPMQLSTLATAQRFPGGFQKFWGLELELPIDWPLPRPVIMDDRTDQRDGFRFMYSLPFGARRVLVEDTRFSDHPQLDRGDCLREMNSYLQRLSVGELSLSRCQILREEHGVLPMPYRGFHPQPGELALTGGYRGNWFHAATGYSFPMALRFAELVAATPIEQLHDRLAAEAASQMPRARFARFLNRLLFELVRPTARHQIFRRFYRVLPEARIARFYSHRFTFGDAIRMVVGLPPTGLQPWKFACSYWSGSQPGPWGTQSKSCQETSTTNGVGEPSMSDNCQSGMLELKP